MSRLRVNPVATPVTMLLTKARVVPHIARARLVSLFGAIVTAPSAIATGCLPIRDITLFPYASEHPAQDLAADLGGAGLVVRHDPARGRQDRYAEPVINPRQLGELGINPPPRLRDARNLPDHRLAIDIFQLDLELGDARTDLLAREAPDVALAPQHIEHVGAEMRRRRGDHRLARPLSVADPGEHVAQRIAHRHRSPPFTNSTSACRGSGRTRPARAP